MLKRIAKVRITQQICHSSVNSAATALCARHFITTVFLSNQKCNVWSKHSIVHISCNLLHVAVAMAIKRLLTRINMETYLQFYATVFQNFTHVCVTTAE
jgi:hypothetical protein